jgi:hypothetical protein
MPTTAAPVRHGSTADYEGLKEDAHRLAREAPGTYAEIADALDVTENAVAKAVTTPGPKFRKLQVRIVELLSDYTVEREVDVQFRYKRKDRTDE